MAESHFERQRREWKAYLQAWWAALRGLPAVIVVLSCIVVLLLAHHRQQEGKVRHRYLIAVQQAAQSEDWSFVETMGRKLIELRPADPVGLYYIALAADANGHHERATRLMNQIAPRDRQGFAPAQWWLVHSMTNRHPQLTSGEVVQVRDHLRQFLQFNNQHAEAHALLAQTELALGNSDEAVRCLTTAGNLNPELKLTAARFATRLGEIGTARTQAEQALRHYRLKIQDNPVDVGARLNLSDTLTMLGETDHAARVIVAGFDMTDDPRLRFGFLRLCCNTFDILQASTVPSENVSFKQLSLLKQSLQISPQSEPILKRLAQLSIQKTPAALEAEDLLKPYLQDGNAPAVVHLVLGTDAINRQQYEIARMHFGRAHELNPRFPACLNNFAWSLAHGERPELQRALTLADQATRQEPERPEFHETRGQILVKLGRFDEAVPELLQGLHTTGDVSATHAELANAYEAIGKPELASYHREQKQSEHTTP